MVWGNRWLYFNIGNVFLVKKNMMWHKLKLISETDQIKIVDYYTFLNILQSKLNM